MIYFHKIKKNLIETGFQLRDSSLENIIWLVNLLPSKAGFSILSDRISAPFWILHLSLLVYVYGVGSVVYQIQYAQGASSIIKSYVNISILALITNNSYWFLTKRPLLKVVIEQVIRNDNLSKESVLLRNKHKKLLSVTKQILLIFYVFNLLDGIFIYIPHRVDITNDYFPMTPCVGLEPLTVSPNREICHIILFMQEFSIMTVILSYQALLLFLIAHTEAMYQMLSAEMLTFDEYEISDVNTIVKERLPSLIERHALTLSTIANLKALYSMPMGVNFGSNAVCICLFFYLSLHEWISFAPVLIYCFLVFFLYCFLCQRLINASEVFENAVYSCGWEKFDIKEKKTLLVMLLQAQKPISLLAADIIPVNIYTFASTLRAMYQFITVVKL